jgi:predicted transcriptional regulator
MATSKLSEKLMMKRTKDLLPKPLKVALISIQPCFVEKILSGEKKLEFRRRWAAEPVDVLVIYSSSPTQRIVATVNIVGVTEGSPTALWNLAKEKGGGVTRQLIYNYFAGKKTGFAIEIADVLQFEHPVDPKKVFKDFLPPQSFRYLNAKDYGKILRQSWRTST